MGQCACGGRVLELQRARHSTGELWGLSGDEIPIRHMQGGVCSAPGLNDGLGQLARDRLRAQKTGVDVQEIHEAAVSVLVA